MVYLKNAIIREYKYKKYTFLIKYDIYNKNNNIS